MEHLLKTGKHKVTAITREESTAKMPAGVEVKRVNYNDPSSLVNALQGQEVLIITLAVTAPPDTQRKLIDAAATANVPWVLPNEWGINSSRNKDLGRDTFIGERAEKVRDHIEQLGKSWWIGISCGFWYEFSLSGTEIRYGFDFPSRKVTLYDDGNTHINTSTWPQCGRAVANLLSLKVNPDDENDKSPCLSQFKNKYVYISSFNVSQRDMLDSVLRVTGTRMEDWKVEYEPSKDRYEAGLKQFQSGDMMGFGKLLYARVFYPDRSGEYESTEGLHNDVLGLPKEDLDEYTKIAVEMAEKGRK